MFQVPSLLATKFGSRKRNEVNDYEGDVTGNIITKNLYAKRSYRKEQ